MSNSKRSTASMINHMYKNRHSDSLMSYLVMGHALLLEAFEIIGQFVKVLVNR